MGSGPPRQGQGSGIGGDTAIEWLPGPCPLLHANRTTGWASVMKAALASAAATIVPMMLGAVPAAASNILVANQDPTAQQTRLDPSAAVPLSSIPSQTSHAVCTSPHVEPATITVTGTAGKVGQPEVYTVSLLGACYISPDSGRQASTVIAAAFTDPRAEDMAWHVTDLAYAPPPATNLVGVRAPDGASVFSRPVDARSTSRIPSSLAAINDTDSGAATFSYGYSSAPDTSSGGVQRNASARASASAMSVTVANFGDYGMAGPSLDRFQSIEGDRYQPADASASLDADGPSSVFTMQSDTNSSLPAGRFRLACRRCRANAQPEQCPQRRPTVAVRDRLPPWRQSNIHERAGQAYSKVTRFRARHCCIRREWRSQALPQRHNDHLFRVSASAQATTRSAFARHV